MRLSVTTPRGALVDTDVEEVTAPGALGEFGVLPGHVPLHVGAEAGRALVQGQGHGRGSSRSGEGFLQVAPLPQADDRAGGRDHVLVLVDQAVHRRRTSTAPAAEKDLAAAERELAAWTGELDGGTRRWSSAAAGPRPAWTPPPASRPTDPDPVPRPAKRGEGQGERAAV